MDDFLTVCETAARAGGRELLAWRGRFKAREKGPADLVTDADLASQAAIREVLSAHFPHHLFLGEEQPSGDEVFDDDEHVWIVDPLDGTTNYVHGYPCFAVSVAIARGRELLAGVIFDPLKEECFSAAQGKGATCNGAAIHTTDVRSVADSLVAISLPARVQPDAPDLADFIRVVQFCQAVRRSGSAAINLAYVACGRLDAFWATQIQPWDVAAGILLVREAGGHVTARDGRPFELRTPKFIAAANQSLHSDLLGVLSGSHR